MQEQNKKRLFIALNLPQNIKDKIFDLIKRLAKQNKETNIKWVDSNNMHLTLHFLGYIDANTEKQIKLAMQCFQGKFGRLKFELSKINAFPSLTNPRVIFLECRQIDSKSIFKLQELLGKKLIQLRIAVDQRTWKPHLTLGRVKEKCNFKIMDYTVVASEFSVNTFELMESELKPAGAEHREVVSYKL
ncbi:MAG: RNA 2',3'-cyclic phosphodiesterase [Patescibacteria group bacterium]|nr:RNA 2',3'-cyclic phosphodiesterase [Patescibacteria group bacterium]